MQRTEASRRSGDTSCEVLPQQELQVRVKDGATTAEGSLTLFTADFLPTKTHVQMFRVIIFVEWGR